MPQQRARRLAKVETWQPVGRITHTLKTCRLPFTGDPAVFIARAAALVPGKSPWRLMLSAFDKRSCMRLCVEYGTDASGVETYVLINLQPADLPIMLRYIVGAGKPTGALFLELDTAEEGDALPVPSVTVVEIAQMPTPSLVCGYIA